MVIGKKKEQELIKVGVLLVLDILEASEEDDSITIDVAERLMSIDEVKIRGKVFPLYQIVDDWCLENDINIS